MKITFLDRNTVGSSIHFTPPAFEHQWQSFGQTQPEQTIERLMDSHIAITNKVVINREIIQACPNLQYIAVAATGVNVIDLEACRERCIHVANVAGYATHAVAEHCFMMMLALYKQLKAYEQALDAGKWQASGQFCFHMDGLPISNLHGKTLGLIGTGSIAQATAKLGQAFGMNVVFYSPSGRSEIEGKATLSLPALLGEADVVSVHCPLTEQTHNLIGAKELSLMKKSAILINTARGPVVDCQAVINALDSQQIAGAGLDVLPEEPPEQNSAIMQELNNPKLIITPHTAWASVEAMQQLADQLMAKINDFVAGKPVDNLAK